MTQRDRERQLDGWTDSPKMKNNYSFTSVVPCFSCADIMSNQIPARVSGTETETEIPSLCEWSKTRACGIDCRETATCTMH